jgi:hypothetical protein
MIQLMRSIVWLCYETMTIADGDVVLQRFFEGGLASTT